MATLKGQNLRLYAGGKPIAAALECQLHIALDTQQLSTKDDVGAWVNNIAVVLKWDVRAQAVVVDEPEDTGALHADTLIGAIGSIMRIEMALASGTQNREQGEVLVTGDAILSDAQVTAQNDQYSVFDIQMTGTQKLMYDLREIITASGHNIRTADGNIVIAPHEL
jgi:hypothetical protein